MNRFSVWLVLCSLLGASEPVFAQTPCYSDQVAQRNLQRFPNLSVQRAALESVLENYLLNSTNQAFPQTVVQIPVVVHIVYKGPLENISDAQIQSQIDVLNTDFRLQNANSADIPAEFQPFAADVEMEFCLASQDPEGVPTIGITRTATSWLNIGQVLSPDGSPRVCYTALGGEDAWDPEHYLNIWVAGIGGGILGFGTFPGTAPPEEEGVVIDPKFFGTVGLAIFNPPNHLGRTATHEIGHYFDLSHIWGGNENVCTDDDGVSDTPVQRGAFFGCPAYPQLSCGNSAMFMNYMDYTDDACMSLFTKGQKARMLAALTLVRPGLLLSQGCAASSTVAAETNAGLRIFPNPASTELRIETNAPSGTSGKIQVMDVCGRIQLQQAVFSDSEVFTVEIALLPAGCYFVQLEMIGSPRLRGIFIKN